MKYIIFLIASIIYLTACLITVLGAVSIVKYASKAIDKITKSKKIKYILWIFIFIFIVAGLLISRGSLLIPLVYLMIVFGYVSLSKSIVNSIYKITKSQKIKYIVLAIMILIPFSLLFYLTHPLQKKNVPRNEIIDPRFSPNGEKLVFSISNTSFYERIRIYLYNLKTKELSVYKAPKGKCFEMASFSPDGKELVFVTEPIGDRNSSIYKQRYAILLNYQIATMDIDGGNMKIQTSNKSFKMYPAFSHKGDKIIYAEASKIRDKGATPALHYNLIELNIKSAKSSLFMGRRFDFYQMGYSTYFNDDRRVLLAGDTPMKNIPHELNIENFSEKTNGSAVFIVKRAQNKLNMPILTRFHLSNKATMDKYENIYFSGEDEKEGSKIVKFGVNKQFTKWNIPFNRVGQFDGMSVSKDGKYIACGWLDSTSKLMLLDTKTGVWNEIVLPKKVKEIPTKINKGVK